MRSSQTAFTRPTPAVAPPELQGAKPMASPSRDRTKLPRRLGALLIEIALTLGAIFGVAVAGVTVTAARSGVQPVVVRSGSMEPTIATGSMILVKRIDASAIRVGDVLAVDRADRTRVTHRVVAVQVRGGAAELTMKGDANEDPDPAPVMVRHAYRLAGQVPLIGRALGWLATAQGGFVMGCIATAFVLRVSARRSRARAGR